MFLNNIFEYAVDPNTISVYIGRLIALDEKFEENGILYVDLTDPDSDDLDSGTKSSVIAQATFALVQSHSLWENPQEVLNKAKFDGSLNFTSSGDFHLKNYCFDMQTMAWFTTVSTLLSALGAVNPPPVMVSLDTTPFGGQAVSINVSTAVKEAADEAISDGLKDTDMNSSAQTPESPIPDKKTVEQTLLTEGNSQQRSLLRDSNSSPHYTGIVSSYDGHDPTMKTIFAIIKPIEDILDAAISPYYEIFECIGLLFEIYDARMTELSEITFPITQFATIKDDGSIENPKPMETLAIKTQLHDRFEQFKTDVLPQIEKARDDLYKDVVDKLYDPINYIYTQISTKLSDLSEPIKKKLIWIISDCLKEVLSKFSDLISMLIQPMVSALPSVIQLVVKLALKKLLKELIGVLITQALSGVSYYIDSIIRALSTNITSYLSDIISTAIVAITNPLVSQIQESMASIICYFDTAELKAKLEAIKSNKIEFPPIYLGSNAVKPYKSFDDIDWSNPQELSAMFLSLIEEVVSENGTVTPEIPFKKKELKETIYVVNLVTGTGSGQQFVANRYIQGYHYQFCKDISEPDKLQKPDQTHPSLKLNTRLGITRTGEQGVVIEAYPNHYGNIQAEGTITSENGYICVNSNLEQDLFFKTFNSKEEFLPYFEALHQPLTEQAVCNYEGNPHPENVTPYLKNITPSRWLTNNVPYIDVEINGKVGRYICNTTGSSIFIKIDKTTSVQINPSQVCYSKEIDHIPESDDDFTVGKDLVPLLDENGAIVYLKIQKLGHTSIDGNTEGLYKNNTLNLIPSNAHLALNKAIWGDEYSTGYDPTREKGAYTFEELASVYYKKEKTDNRYYAWMTTGLVDSKEIEAKDVQSKEASNKVITDMLQDSVTSMGMTEGFNSTYMMKAIKSKIMSTFDKIADAISQVSSAVDSSMSKSLVDASSGMESIINNLSIELGNLKETLEKVYEKAEPALVATAKAASSVAIQSCSMSQNAKDKDASFTTNDSYDLSITTEPKSLHPYHNRLKREKFLEPNCKLLILAVGSGTKNLVAVDILS